MYFRVNSLLFTFPVKKKSLCTKKGETANEQDPECGKNDWLERSEYTIWQRIHNPDPTET